MTVPLLTEDEIREHTAGGSFERGRQYLEDGAVQSVTQTDDHTLKAKVQGSDVHPYLVTVQFDADEITEVQCTCPYYEGSWCKHIVAVLLKVIEGEPLPQSDPAAVADLIEDLDRNDLVALVERLVEHNPGLLDQIERERAQLRRTSEQTDGTAE